MYGVGKMRPVHLISVSNNCRVKVRIWVRFRVRIKVRVRVGNVDLKLFKPFCCIMRYLLHSALLTISYLTVMTSSNPNPNPNPNP